MAALSTIAAVGAGLLASKVLKPKGTTSTPTPAPLPAPPSTADTIRQQEEAAQTAAAIRNRQNTAAQAGGTLLTGPYAQAPAPVQRKTLLGS